MAPHRGYIPQPVIKLTGIEYHGGIMYHNSLPVHTVQMRNALQSFNDWLTELDTDEPVLVAHNASFDARMLLQEYERASMELSHAVTRFADTLPHLKAKFPGRKGNGGYKLSTLVQEFLPGQEFDFHDATEDTRSLAELLTQSGIDGLHEHFLSADEIQSRRLANKNKRENLASYHGIDKSRMSNIVAEKLAKSGLNLQHLRVVYGRSGSEGLQTLIRARCGNSRFNIEEIILEM